MRFDRMQKEYFRLRGELQNDTITGVNSDEKTHCKNLLNQQMREIAKKRPPFLKTEFHISAQPKVDLTNTTDVNTATGTKGLPILSDSSSNITTKQRYWMISEGTYQYRVIGESGTSISLDSSLHNTATTADTYTAYKDIIPLPHNCGPVIKIEKASGGTPLERTSGTAFNQLVRDIRVTAEPNTFAIDAYANRYSKYKFGSTGTFTNDSNVAFVTNPAYFDVGDVILVDTSTTDEHLHTCIGVDTANSNIYLDRMYTGTTEASATVYVNPVAETHYVSLHPLPVELEDLVIEAYVKPQNMVSDADECIFDEDYCRAIIVGAILEDRLGRRFLTEQDVAFYGRMMEELQQTQDASIVVESRKRRIGGGKGFRTSSITT